MLLATWAHAAEVRFVEGLTAGREGAPSAPRSLRRRRRPTSTGSFPMTSPSPGRAESPDSRRRSWTATRPPERAAAGTGAPFQQRACRARCPGRQGNRPRAAAGPGLHLFPAGQAHSPAARRRKPSYRTPLHAEIHGDVSLTVGGGSHGSSFYGTSFDLNVTDPSGKFTLGVGVRAVSWEGIPSLCRTLLPPTGPTRPTVRSGRATWGRPTGAGSLRSILLLGGEAREAVREHVDEEV